MLGAISWQAVSNKTPTEDLLSENITLFVKRFIWKALKILQTYYEQTLHVCLYAER